MSTVNLEAQEFYAKHKRLGQRVDELKDEPASFQHPFGGRLREAKREYAANLIASTRHLEEHFKEYLELADAEDARRQGQAAEPWHPGLLRLSPAEPKQPPSLGAEILDNLTWAMRNKGTEGRRESGDGDGFGGDDGGSDGGDG